MTDLQTFATVTSLKVSWPWYMVRASGIVAVILMLLVIFSGIGMVTGATYRFIEPLKAWTLHKTLSIALSVSVLLHIGFLLVEKFEPYSLGNILVPFSVHYEHSKVFGMSAGSFYNAIGIIATYLLIAVMLSSLYIIETKKRLWRWLHYLSYPLMFMIFFHTLFLGTDFKHGILRFVWIIFGLLLVVGTVSRLMRAKTLSTR